MKRPFFYLITGLFLLPGIGLSMQAKLDDKLPEPPYRELFDTSDRPVTKLAQLLKGGRLRQFYEDVRPLLKEIDRKWDEEPTEESFKTDLWLCYLIASAPMLSVDGDEQTNYGGDSSDYMVKWGTLQVIYHHDIDKLTKRFKINRKELTKLLASYAAGIMRRYYDDYDPYFKEKDRALRRKRWEEKITDGEREFNNRQISLGSRNNSAGHDLRYLEKGFVTQLLKYFPGNANEIHKYARLAGYKNDELAELFELTAGRSKETEFLYKGIPAPNRNRKKEDVRRDIALPKARE